MDEFQRASTGLSTNDEAKKSANAIFQVCSGFENSHASTSTLAMCNAQSRLVQPRSTLVSMLHTS